MPRALAIRAHDPPAVYATLTGRPPAPARPGDGRDGAADRMPDRRGRCLPIYEACDTPHQLGRHPFPAAASRRRAPFHDPHPGPVSQ
jgi:hypothetical protein